MKTLTKAAAMDRAPTEDTNALRLLMTEKLLGHREIDPTTNCWIWTGAWCSHGMGKVCLPRPRDRSKALSVARVAAWLWRGKTLFGVHVVARNRKVCKHPACFNPDHLRVFRNRDAFHRCMNEQRPETSQRGETHRWARITFDEACFVVDAVRERTETDGEIRDRLNSIQGGSGHLTEAIVRDIRRRVRWKVAWAPR